MGRRAARREDSAARLRALTRRAYTASSGHLDLDDDAGREFDRIVQGDPGEGRPTPPPTRRWAVSVRAALVVLAVVAALTGVVVVRSLATASAPVPVPELAEPSENGTGNEGGGGSRSGLIEEGAGDDGSGDGSRTSRAADGSTAAGGASEGESPGAAEGSDAGPVVVVHVAGAVAAPGVVDLPDGARVAHAIEAAGGADSDAELAAVNLARLVQDGEQIYVPRVGEAQPGAAARAMLGGAGPGDADTEGPSVVDLNTADAAALDTLPGVGPAIAQRILDWREAHGPFHSVDELLEVSGIGPATLERLRDRVRV